MKKSLTVFVSALLSFVFVAAVCLPHISLSASKPPVQSVAKREISAVSSDGFSEKQKKVMEKRFLNMLNHNFVYGEDFNSAESMVNGSVLALLGLRDREDNSYIADYLVADYMFNMYGIRIDDFSQFNPDMPCKAGFVYIVPRGYSQFRHSFVSATENEDGSYTVKTKVTVSSHDGEDYSDYCTTMFVKNSNSQFGFNIISSDIGSDAFKL